MAKNAELLPGNHLDGNTQVFARFGLLLNASVRGGIQIRADQTAKTPPSDLAQTCQAKHSEPPVTMTPNERGLRMQFELTQSRAH